MEMGFNFEMDSSNRRDRRILSDLVQGVARMAPMLGEIVKHVNLGGYGFDAGQPVASVHPFPDIHAVPNGAPVTSMSEVRGRDALRALVVEWRTVQDVEADRVWTQDSEARADGFRETLVATMTAHGSDLVAYVDSVEGPNRLVTALCAVWRLPGISRTPEQMGEDVKGAQKLAGFLVSTASALGFGVPAAWYSLGGV